MKAEILPDEPHVPIVERRRVRYLVETFTDLDKDGKHSGIYRPFSYMASRTMTEAEEREFNRGE